MAQFRWDPDSYLALMHEEVPDYDELQDQVAARAGVGAARMLELGTGTGETARRVLAVNPDAHLVGLDASRQMLDQARSTLPGERVELVVSQLEDPFPPGQFDLVFSALAVHHLNRPGKADLFRRVAAVLAPAGRFVLGDVIVPEDPEDVVTPIDDGYDIPSTAAEQLAWLKEAGLNGHVAWQRRDLAVLVAEVHG